jgi:hypothetical protein
MKTSEARELIKAKILTRWPKWDCTSQLMADLIESLVNFIPDQVEQAAKKLRAENSYDGLDMGKLISYCKSAQITKEYQDICISRVYLGGANSGIAKSLVIGYTSNSWYKVQSSIDMNNPEKQMKLIGIERQSTEKHYGNEAQWEFYYMDETSARQRSYELKGFLQPK